MKKYLFFFSIFVFIAGTVMGQVTVTTTGTSTSWNDPTCWDINKVPGKGTGVDTIIIIKHAVTFDLTGATVDSLIVDDATNGYLTISSSNTLNVNGGLVVNAGTVEISGTLETNKVEDGAYPRDEVYGTLTVNSGGVYQIDYDGLTMKSGGTLTNNSGGTVKIASLVNRDLYNSGTVSNEGTFYVQRSLTCKNGSSFTQSGGSLTTKNLTVDDGGSFSFSGGTCDVSARLLVSGTLSLSNNVNLNVASKPIKNVNNLGVYSTASFTLASGTSITILNGNSDASIPANPVMYYYPLTSSISGKIVIKNTSDSYVDGADSSFIVDSEYDLPELEIDVTADTLRFSKNCNISVGYINLQGGNIQVDPEAELTLTNLLTPDNSFSISSDASVIFENAPTTDGTTAASVKAERILENTNVHFISAPVKDTRTYSTVLSDILDAGDYFYSFEEWLNTGTWAVIYPTGGSHWGSTGYTGGAFSDTLCKGYTIQNNTQSHSDEDTIVFSGTVNMTSLTKKLTKTDGTNNGWNLIGNPYTAPLGIKAFLKQNSTQLDASYAAAYVWDENSADWNVKNSATTGSDSLIAVAQGFMVRTAAYGNTVTFNTNMEFTGTTTFYKNSKSDNWVNSCFEITDNNGLKNETYIAFNENMTKGLDVTYDAGKINGNPDIALYTKLADNNLPEINFAIQALPLYENETEGIAVKTGFNVAQAGEYTLQLKKFLCNFDSAMLDKTMITLEDAYTNQVTDIKENGYTFYSENGTFNDRFIIHFSKKITSIENPVINADADAFLVYADAEGINIKNLQEKNYNNVSISIYDVSGRKLYHKEVSIKEGEKIKISGLSVHRLVLVSIREANHVQNKKLIIR